jgi:hypothetical protein
LGGSGRALGILWPALALLAACRPSVPEERPMRPIADVLASHTPDLMKIPGVVGTAESRLEDGRPCVLVLVVKLTSGLRRAIPATLEGYPVKIQETGEIRALPGASP